MLRLAYLTFLRTLVDLGPDQLRMLHHLPPKAFLSLQRCLLARDGPACSIMSGTVLRCVQFLTKQTWLAGSRLSGFYVCTLPDCFFRKWLQILEIKIFMDPLVPILVLAAHDSKLSSTLIDETSAVAFQVVCSVGIDKVSFLTFHPG